MRTISVRVGDLDVAVEVVTLPGSEDTSRASKAADGVLDAFDHARRAIVEIAASVADIIEATRARAACPDQLEFAFGLKISAEGGVIVAGVAAEASLQVKLVYDVASGAAVG